MATPSDQTPISLGKSRRPIPIRYDHLRAGEPCPVELAEAESLETARHGADLKSGTDGQGAARRHCPEQLLGELLAAETAEQEVRSIAYGGSPGTRSGQLPTSHPGRSIACTPGGSWMIPQVVVIGGPGGTARHLAAMHRAVSARDGRCGSFNRGTGECAGGEGAAKAGRSTG